MEAKAGTSVESVSSVGLPIEVGAPSNRSFSSPLLGLYAQLCCTFEAERNLGVKVGKDQDADSFARLEGRVNSLLAGYLSSGHGDWNGYARFSPEHYTRNLVGRNEDFEMLVRGSRLSGARDIVLERVCES